MLFLYQFANGLFRFGRQNKRFDSPRGKRFGEQGAGVDPCRRWRERLRAAVAVLPQLGKEPLRQNAMILRPLIGC